MIHLIYIFLLLFISIFIELLFGSFSVIVPSVALLVYYLTMIYNLKAGIILAIISGFILDALYGRSLLISPVSFSVISIFSVFWLHKGVVSSIHLQMLPGSVISFIYTFPMLAINYFLYESGFILFFINILVLLITVILGAILLPIMILILDFINIKLKINLYIDSKKRLNESI